MNYEILTSNALFTLFQNNMLALAGAINSMIGEGPFPDPRITAKIIQEMPFEGFMESMMASKSELSESMDVQEMVANITRENVEIQKEFLKRL